MFYFLLYLTGLQVKIFQPPYPAAGIRTLVSWTDPGPLEGPNG